MGSTLAVPSKQELVGLVHGGLLLGAVAPLARLLGANGVTVAPAAGTATPIASAIAFHVSAVCGAAHFAKRFKDALYTIFLLGEFVGDRPLPLAEVAIPSSLTPRGCGVGDDGGAVWGWASR